MNETAYLQSGPRQMPLALPPQYSVKASTAGNSAQLSNHSALNYWLQSQLRPSWESNPVSLTQYSNLLIAQLSRSTTEIIFNINTEKYKEPSPNRPIRSVSVERMRPYP